MCGIFCLLADTCEQTKSETLKDVFKAFENLIIRRGPDSFKAENCSVNKYDILLASSVLWLQGSEITTQPLELDDSMLLYNGDIFGGPMMSEILTNNCGDTEVFFKTLRNTGSIVESLNDIDGPYAFIYLDLKSNILYFGRDKYGRRSLLIGKKESHFIITSVANRHTRFNFVEVPCIGIFSVDLNNRQWQLFAWRKKNKNFVAQLEEMETFLGNVISTNRTEFEEVSKFKPPHEKHLTMLEKLATYSSIDILHYFSNSFYPDKIVQLKYFLENSVKKRILTQPKFCRNCFKDYDCKHAMTGVLFSGGVDCAVLALLANSFVDDERPIDLINVAFEKGGTFSTPDRVTGLSTLRELQMLCPKRKWNFVEVNVKKKELDSCRSQHISDLIYPLNSILDDSLGCALWFAARGMTDTYNSPCRTLLVGMGADELFGGYTRHRAALQKNGWESLYNVLDEDWQNLPHRNLARDDRVVSDHGRQLRTPYLDEEVVKFVQSLNCWEKTLPTKNLPQGVGEKILLRSLAYHLGLREAAVFKKRALQFGSRIADPKEKGHEISTRLLK